MRPSDLDHFDLLARIDDLTGRVRAWSAADIPWKPLGRVRGLVDRVLARIDTMRLRLAAPLIVAMFGGTGTGKSSLVNALVGTEISPSGRQRPTTRRPVLLAHRELELEQLGFDTSGYDLRRFDLDELREIVLIDCPDPDTSEGDEAGSNLALLRSVVPHSDVLIFTATQQKYRSDRVIRELKEAATGCRLLFVQTHADRDEDIREDWKRHLLGFEVPTMFFIDSVEALADRQSGRAPSGDFARLNEVLQTELAVGARTSVRRANVLDLLAQSLAYCQRTVDEALPAVNRLEEELSKKRHQINAELTERLKEELLSSRHLWQHRILSAVTEYWGMSPFSSMLRIYNGLGGFLASMTVYRARNVAQVALVGAAEGARRLRAWSQEREAADRTGRLDSLTLDDATLRSARVALAGYADEAGIPLERERANLADLHAAASQMEQNFLGGARQEIDGIIRDIASRNSRWYVRWWYELLLGVYLLFIIWRIGKNFFWDSFFAPYWLDAPQSTSLLPMEFYVTAGVIFLLWTGLLVILYSRRLQRGLDRRIRQLAEGLSSRHLAGGLFPECEENCQRVRRHVDELRALRSAVEVARANLVTGGNLGQIRATAPASVPSARTE